MANTTAKSTAKVVNKKAAVAANKGTNPARIRFFYKNNKNEAGIRTVTNPTWGRKGGKWTMTGHDVDAKAVRSFHVEKMSVID